LVEQGRDRLDRRRQARTIAFRLFDDRVKLGDSFVELRVDHSHSVGIEFGNLLIEEETESVVRCAGDIQVLQSFHVSGDQVAV
jgi:hypothetical protein